MPPPKKPKNGPTTVEQFLSQEELQKMAEAGSGVRTVPSPGPSTNTSGRDKNSDNWSCSGGHVSGEIAASSSAALLSFAAFASNTTADGSNSSGITALDSASSSFSGELQTEELPNTRFRLLRELFAKRDADMRKSETTHLQPAAVSEPLRQTSHPKRSAGTKGREHAQLEFSDRGGSNTREHWQINGSGGGAKSTSQSSGASLDKHSGKHHRGANRNLSSSSTVPGEGTVLPPKDISDRTYLTKLIKEPPSSGASSTVYLDHVAMNSGKMVHGQRGTGGNIMTPVMPQATCLHAAFQLPLIDTNTSGHHITSPLNTSMFAYISGPSAHPNTQVPISPHSLSRFSGSSTLPLVEANVTSVTSFITSSLSLNSLTNTSTSVPSSQSSGNEPFDLSFKKRHQLYGSSDVDIKSSSEKSIADIASQAGSLAESGGSIAESGISFSPSFSSFSNTSNTSVSPSVVNMSSVRGSKDGSGSSPGLSKAMAANTNLIDFPVTVTSSPLSKLYLEDSTGSTTATSTATAATTVASTCSRPLSSSSEINSPTKDAALSPNREPSDSKVTRGDSQGHNHLVSCGAGPGQGSRPGGGSRVVGPVTPGGVGPSSCSSLQGPSLMSTTGHLQAPTSTTPEGGGVGGSSGSGMHPNFLSMETHPSPLGHSDIHIKQEISAGSSTPAKLCQVCNDNASGFHYGVWSCEGCKAFFKRSIQGKKDGPVDYMCPATNNCTIDKHRRKSCQACRLRKCYEVGMNKGSQRKERKHSGASASSSFGKNKRCRADSTEVSVNSTNGGGGASATKFQCAKRARCNSILEALQKADLPVLESYHNHELPPTRVHILNTLIKLADRELVYLINWAKHVPGYTDLSLSDQVHLIECCWMELLLLNCAFRSMDHEGKRLVFAPDFHLDRQLWNVTGMTEILEQVAAVSEQMVQFAVSKEELLLLQATVLVNAEVRRLASYSKIGEMRQMIVDAFVEVAQRTHPENMRHVPSLLLLLTHIRQAGERGIAYFQSLKREGCVSFCDLLMEMLEAHNSAAIGAAATMASSLPSTSAADVDRKNITPSQLGMGGIIVKRDSHDDGSMNPYV